MDTTTNTDAQAQPTYTPDYPDSGYAGHEWIEAAQKCWRERRGKPLPGAAPISDFGRRVADTLGDVFAGIYHLDRGALSRVDWSDADNIQVILYGELATWDFTHLTRLVLFAHNRHVRVAVSGASNRHLRVTFSRRDRDGDTYHRHPTIDEQVRRLAAEMEK